MTSGWPGIGRATARRGRAVRRAAVALALGAALMSAPPGADRARS